MMDGDRPGRLFPGDPRSLPAVIYDTFICPLSRWRGLNYATMIVNRGADRAVSIMEVYIDVALE